MSFANMQAIESSFKSLVYTFCYQYLFVYKDCSCNQLLIRIFAPSLTLTFLGNFCQLISIKLLLLFLFKLFKEVVFLDVYFAKLPFHFIPCLCVAGLISVLIFNVYVIRLLMQTCHSNSFNISEVYISASHILTRSHMYKFNNKTYHY